MKQTFERRTSRRAFLAKGAAAGALTLGAGRLLIDTPAAAAGEGLPAGDAAILRFLAAAELLEADLWKQYNDLGGVQDAEVPGGTGNRAYTRALAVIDKDMHQYIHDNADDEQSHANFINSYLQARGEQPVDLDPFRTLPGSKASGAAQIGRLTNLMELTVDTSYWTATAATRRTPTSVTPLARPFLDSPRGSSLRSRAATTTCGPPSISRRSRTRQPSISG